jgi:hypothetical protein
LQRLVHVSLRHKGNVRQADGKIEWPETRVSALVHNSSPGAVCYVALPDIVGLLAALSRESLTALLDKQITAKSDDARALTPEQRQKQTAQTMEELFVIETNEATLTLEAWESGLPIEANANIQPAALLAVRNVVAPPADASTSPEHAYTVRR